jgi:DNA-binding MarR family transcriptional regulator
MTAAEFAGQPREDVMGEPAHGDEVDVDVDAEVDSDAWELMLAVHRLARLMRGAAPQSGLSPTRLLVLSLLAEHGPARVGAIAGMVPCSQPTATTLVAHLEADGLVRRAPDPADGRAVVITVTGLGREQIRTVALGGAALLRRRIAALPPERRGAISEALPLLRALCGDPLD